MYITFVTIVFVITFYKFSFILEISFTHLNPFIGNFSDIAAPYKLSRLNTGCMKTLYFYHNFSYIHYLPLHNDVQCDIFHLLYLLLSLTTYHSCLITLILLLFFSNMLVIVNPGNDMKCAGSNSYILMLAFLNFQRYLQVAMCHFERIDHDNHPNY